MTDVSEPLLGSYRTERLREALALADLACQTFTGLRANLEAAVNPAASDEDHAGGTFCARRNARMITPQFLEQMRELRCTVETLANADAFGWSVDGPDAARYIPARAAQ